MDYPGLKEYVDSNLKVKAPAEVRQELLRSGFPAEAVDSAIADYYVNNPPNSQQSSWIEASNNSSRKSGKRKWFRISLIVVLVLLLTVVLTIGYIYYFVINPIFIHKPNIEKTAITNSSNNSLDNSSVQTIGAENLIYLLNEIEAYKLHSSPSGEKPLINFIIIDTNRVYSFTVEDNNIISQEFSDNPDVVMRVKEAVIIDVYQAQNTKEKIMKGYNEGSFEIELKKDLPTLAMKGYNSVASYFGITGFSISETKNLWGVYAINPFIFTVVWGFIIMFLALGIIRIARN
jgi:hypothetical protein